MVNSKYLLLLYDWAIVNEYATKKMAILLEIFLKTIFLKGQRKVKN